MQPTKVGDIIVVYPQHDSNSVACHNGANKIPAIVTQTFDSHTQGECNCRAFTDGPGDMAPLWFTSIKHKSFLGVDEDVTCWDWV